MSSSTMRIHGYTTLMCPEHSSLPYLETLLSWATICDTLHVCYSTFPDLKLPVPDGAFTPWEDDGSRQVLERFNKEMLGGKLTIVDHEWNPNEPREDGYTKQAGRESALQAAGEAREGKGKDDWLFHFDADEVLPDDAGMKLLEIITEDNKQEFVKRRPFLVTGILEMFGGVDRVRFNFGNWCKIRGTRNVRELMHGMPLNLNGMSVRGRHKKTGKIIAIDNRDDGAGFISSLSLTRPDYNQGLWAVDKNVMNQVFQLRQVPAQHPLWAQAPLALQNDMMSGVWLFHTSWIDIARKWGMGWFFDNFWSVLNGKQERFTEKAEKTGTFTHTRIPEGEELTTDLAKEMENPTIKPLPAIEIPQVFSRVREWRASAGVPNDVPGIPYE